MDGTEKTGKKLSLVYILLILKKYSDLQHALSQQDILQYLEKDYGMVIARKSVKRNLEVLRTAGLPVRCREVRRSRSEKEEMISLDWYYEHLLEENELSALLDGLYFSHGNYGFIKATAGKIRREASPFADGDRDFMRNIPAENKKSDDGETGKTLRIIADAVRQKHKISFFYDHYEADGKKHHNQYPAGVDQKYEVSPYWVLTADGHYYLCACPSQGEEAVLYHVERISEAEVLTDIPVRPSRSVRGIEKGVLLPKSLGMFPYVTGIESELCTFRADHRIITQVIEDFGKSAHFLSADALHAEVQTEADPHALALWAAQHAPYVRITGPPSLVKVMKKTAAAFYELYHGD